MVARASSRPSLRRLGQPVMTDHRVVVEVQSERSDLIAVPQTSEQSVVAQRRGYREEFVMSEMSRPRAEEDSQIAKTVAQYWDEEIERALEATGEAIIADLRPKVW